MYKTLMKRNATLKGLVMYTECHGFHGRFSRLTENQLFELVTVLALPDNPRPKQLKNGKYILQFAFSGSNRSVYFWLGDRDANLWGGEAVYENVRVELHGSFFDASPDFDFANFLKVLENIYTFRPTQLDIGYQDDTQKTTIDDWRRVLTHPEFHCVGNLFKPFPHTEIVKSRGKFSRIHIGKPTSKTCYGTVYRRPSGEMRLELKFRKMEYIRAYCDDLLDGFNGHNAAISVLLENMDILTVESKSTKNPSKYEREPFFAAFLNSRGRRDSKERRTKMKTEARTASAHGTFKHLAARLQGGLPKLEVFMGLDELSQRLTEATGYLINISNPRLVFD